MKITGKIIEAYKKLTSQDKKAIVNMMTEYKRGRSETKMEDKQYEYYKVRMMAGDLIRDAISYFCREGYEDYTNHLYQWYKTLSKWESTKEYDDLPPDFTEIMKYFVALIAPFICRSIEYSMPIAEIYRKHLAEKQGCSVDEIDDELEDYPMFQYIARLREED